jgi:hypothetical protein
MEIKITFSTIIGIIMVVTVTVAAIAILGSLTRVNIEECIPAEYVATTGFRGEGCGTDSNGNQVKCDVLLLLPDRCVDSSKNLCCPIFSSRRQYQATSDLKGEGCGIDANNIQVKCDINDRCIDSSKNTCLQQNIRVINGKCCKITKI